MEAAKLSVANVAEAFSLFVTFLARLMMVGNVSNVGNVTAQSRSRSQATLTIGLIHSAGRGQGRSFYLCPVNALLLPPAAAPPNCFSFVFLLVESWAGKILFDVGADCLLMSDAGDISRVLLSSAEPSSAPLAKRPPLQTRPEWRLERRHQSTARELHTLRLGSDLRPPEPP